VALLVTAVLPGCSRDSDAGGQEESRSASAGEPPALRVVVEKPLAVSGAEAMVLPGTVEAWESARLYARVTGYLEEVDVDIGDEVAAGDRVARVLIPEMAADIAGAEARLAKEKADLELARLTHARLQALRELNPAAVPQQDVDTAAAQVEVEKAQRRVAEADRDRLHALRELARLVAPFPGRITRRVLHPGALVREGNSPGAEPVVEIARTDRLRLVFEIPEPLAPHVQEQMPVVLRFDAFPGSEVAARVARLAGALDPSTRAMRAELDLTDGAGRYRPGMYASVTIDVDAADGALSVPSRAVRGHGDDRFVFVAEEGVLRRRPVVVASDDGRRALVVRGLGADDRVMVAGSPLAQDGVRCEAVEG
jgi:RND family efflux transporter MFP subunit